MDFREFGRFWVAKVSVKHLIRFFRGFGMAWKLQKYCFTAVKHTFSQIPFTDSGVTFRYYLDHFWVALEAPP